MATTETVDTLTAARLTLAKTLARHVIKNYAVDGKITSESWRTAFAAYDRDKDGYITAEELAVWLSDASVGTDFQGRSDIVIDMVMAAEIPDGYGGAVKPGLSIDDMMNGIQYVYDKAQGGGMTVAEAEASLEAFDWKTGTSETKPKKQTKSADNTMLWVLGGALLLLMTAKR